METHPGDLLPSGPPRLIRHLFNALPEGRLAVDRAGMAALADALPDALLVVDRDGRILLANRALKTVTGHDPQRLQGQNLNRLLLADQSAPVLRPPFDRLPDPYPMGRRDMVSLRHADGRELSVEVTLTPIEVDGAPHMAIAFRKAGAYPRVQRALRLARHYEQLAELARLAVDLTDPRELMEPVADLAIRALGGVGAAVYLVEPGLQAIRVVSLSGLGHGRAVGDVIPIDPRHHAGYVMTHGEVLIVPNAALETRIDIPVAATEAGVRSGIVVPIPDQGHVEGVLTVASQRVDSFEADDVKFLQAVANILATGLRRAQAEQRLRQAHKMEAIGQLTGGIAHDFNNLLTIIQGNLQMAEEYLVAHGGGQGLSLVQAAGGASQRAAQLTGQLLAFSRRQVLLPGRVELQALFPPLMELLRRTLGESITLHWRVAPDTPACLADKVQLESALLNMAINARDAMPDGGALSFVCTPHFGPIGSEPGSSRTPGPEPTGVQIVVTDTGLGMTAAVKEHAFEPFFTTKASGRGTGLGLSSAYGFAHQSRGHIRLDSTPGQGTTITLVLPASGGETPDSHGLPSERHELPAGLRVLLVEDDPDVRHVTWQFLQSLHCSVSQHASAETAWSELQGPSTCDLLLTDVELGQGMKGTALANQVHERHPALAILLCSGYSQNLNDERLQELERWPLLRKPFSKGELAAAMRQALAAAAPQPR